MEFFPSILDIDKHISTIAFGYRGFYLDHYNIYQHLKNTRLAQLFSDDKLEELSRAYSKYAPFINRLTAWAKWFIYDKDPSTRPENITFNDTQMIKNWNKNVFELYELYRVSESLFEKVLYTQLLNDHLWNPKLDPRNPKVQQYYLQKLSNAKKDISNFLSESSIEPFMVIDADSYKLTNHGLNTDTVSIFNRSFSNIRNIIESSGDINSIKTEVAKLQFIKTLIESDFIFSDFVIDKDSYLKHRVLRDSINKSLKECVEFIKSVEKDFELESFYESTNFYKLSMNEYRHVKMYKEFINHYL